MLKIEKYGAVDIGSNAVRLLVATVIEQEGRSTLFKKTSWVRVPIRLGADVFENGTITEDNKQRLADTLMAFRLLMKSHRVRHFRVCATSAMREASNGDAIAKYVEEKSGLNIEVIDGDEEAAIIVTTDLKNLIQDDRIFLFVDVGGGSTELTLFENGQKGASTSLKLGSVRTLKSNEEAQEWTAMEKWIKTHTANYRKISLIGSGGNINTIFKRSGKKAGKPMSYRYLSDYYDYLKSLSYEERITELDMNTDRADVVIPATKIYLSAMKWCRGSSMYVPKIGLSDGIIRKLYETYKNR